MTMKKAIWRKPPCCEICQVRFASLRDLIMLLKY